MPWGVAGARSTDAQSRGDPFDAATRRAAERVYSAPQPLADGRANGARSASCRTARRSRDSEVATLLEPDGPNATAYLLTANYRAILDYNCSNFYALSVGLLANAIVRR